MPENLLSIISVFILAATLVAILWYSVETRLLRIETSKLREIQI